MTDTSSQTIPALQQYSLAQKRQMLRIMRSWRDAWAFATEHHKNTKGNPMRFGMHYRYLRQIYHDTSKVLAIMSSVQTGKTEYLIIQNFAFAKNGLFIFYVLPKSDFRSTFVQNRINRTIDMVSAYQTLEQTALGDSDSVNLKHFGNGATKFVSSNVPADFTEFPADVIIIDELDKCNPENLIFADDRMEASDYRIKRVCSNPSIKGYGIHRLYQAGTQNEWVVPCTECGEFQPISWFSNVVNILDADRNEYELLDSDWTPDSHRDIQVMCRFCGGVLKRDAGDAHWAEQNPSGKHASYHIHQLMMPSIPIELLWSEFLGALGNEIQLQRFFNSKLGLPFEGIGSKITRDILLDNTMNYLMSRIYPTTKKEQEGALVTMGVDVGNEFDVRISKVYYDRDVDAKRRMALHIGKYTSEDMLYELMARYNVDIAVFDAMPEKRNVEKIRDKAMQYDVSVWKCFRFTDKTGKRDELKIDFAQHEIHVERTYSLDLSMSELQRGVNVLPSNTLELLDGKYVEEMMEPTRLLKEDGQGRQYYIWTKGHDHQRDADVYDILAGIGRLRGGQVRA